MPKSKTSARGSVASGKTGAKTMTHQSKKPARGFGFIEQSDTRRGAKTMVRQAEKPTRGFGFIEMPDTRRESGTGRSGGKAGTVVRIRSTMQLTQEELGRATGYSTRAIAGWEGGQKLSESARQKLAETERLSAALTQIMPDGDVGEWLRRSNPAFENQTPLQVIERGESDRIWRMIFQIEANVAS